MLLAKIIFTAVITVILGITISNFNKEFKVHITVIFGILMMPMLFRELKIYVQEFIDIFIKYNIKTEYFSTILKNEVCI